MSCVVLQLLPLMNQLLHVSLSFISDDQQSFFVLDSEAVMNSMLHAPILPSRSDVVLHAAVTETLATDLE